MVNQKELRVVKELIEKKEDNVVLIPAYKSYVDFILIAYIHFYYNIDIPFFCSPEDMLHISFFSYLIRSGGGFFLNTKHLKNDLFIAVMKAYVSVLFKNNTVVEMFIEKQRSRSGKIQQPRQVLFDFTINNFLSTDTEIAQKKDIKFVPITINYDRVYEGETFPLELLGETKQ